MTLDEIDGFLVEAIRTLIALPDREARWLYPKLSHWPHVMPDETDVAAKALERLAAGKSAFALPHLKRAPPDPEAIDRMLPTLDWLKFTDGRGRKLIWRRAFKTPWWILAGMFGRSESQVQRWHKTALEQIRDGLDGKKTLPLSRQSPKIPLASARRLDQ